MEIIKKKSPNYTPSKRRTIDTIVVHATAGQMPGALLWMMNKTARVSSHYLIDRKGYVFQLVEEANIAWHAGKSKWNGKPHVNLNSIGIELENDNVGQEYTSKQFDALLDLTVDLVLKYDISLQNIVRHADISPGRKTDPFNFPWKRFLNIMSKTVIWRDIKEKDETQRDRTPDKSIDGSCVFKKIKEKLRWTKK